MNHEDYKSSALSESPKIKVAKTTHIVSSKHNLYTVDRIKRKLSCYKSLSSYSVLMDYGKNHNNNNNIYLMK